MKWLFAILAALNIIVFGSTIVYKTTADRSVQNKPIETRTHELARPKSLETPPQTASAPLPDWIAAEESTRPAAEPESEEALAERRKKEARLAKEKKEREEKARRERENRIRETEAAEPETQTGSATGVARLCTASANITMDEDDYHRIKGLLSKWPHAASRSVEKRQSAKSSQKTFRILLPVHGDPGAQIDALNEKGFSASMYNGELSAGITRSRSSAQIIISRLSAAGFGGAHIVEHEEQSAGADTTLSVGRMSILFMAVDEKDTQEIRNIVGRYGTLNTRSCK